MADRTYREGEGLVESTGGGAGRKYRALYLITMPLPPRIPNQKDGYFYCQGAGAKPSVKEHHVWLMPCLLQLTPQHLS